MKISFIVPWITQSRGGTENVGHLMANSMARRGHEVNVYTFDDAHRPSVWPLDHDVKLRYLPEGNNHKSNYQMAVALAEASPDLIVGLHLNRMLLQYVVAAHKIGVPIVLSEHIDPHFPVRVGTFTDGERQAALVGATRIHLLTSKFKDTIPGYLRDRVDVIPNTVMTARKPSDPKGGVRKYLIAVAGLVPRKNIAQLIGEFSLIASKHKDWTLQILGDGPLKDELRKLSKVKGIARQVEFLGRSTDPYSKLEKAQLFVMPSLFEGFPMASLEAMTHGMPLVGYAACNGINEQIVDGVNGRLAASNLETGCLASCLDELMSDEDARVRMGAEAKQRFDALYSNSIVFDAWEKVFNAAVRAGPAVIATSSETRALHTLDQLIDG